MILKMEKTFLEDSGLFLCSDGFGEVMGVDPPITTLDPPTTLITVDSRLRSITSSTNKQTWDILLHTNKRKKCKKERKILLKVFSKS